MSELCCAVGLSQLEKLDYLVNKRIEIANKFNDLLQETNCDWLLPQKVNDYIKHTYWGFIKLTRDDISFIDFRDKLMIIKGAICCMGTYLLEIHYLKIKKSKIINGKI